jgi:hypothetical protein
MSGALKYKMNHYMKAPAADSKKAPGVTGLYVRKLLHFCGPVKKMAGKLIIPLE